MKIPYPISLIICLVFVLTFAIQQGYSQSQYTFEEIDSLLKAYGESAEAKKRIIFKLLGVTSLGGINYFGVRGITG